ncbi:glycosyl hydrolase [Arthrobacter psychrolactophilus]|uniref:Glycosyl hydrolase n=1 Tax=Arthrobacter psychrolactophilus TaxID=92442 RepID=A0A2V5IXG1_9MICC|nr:glycoside hydrolase family 76 protein [Arthrobacter psychrolactophilus]PYI38964.1 glycosyl hydrolase [Arthrobacter psychrolactophilus]
MTGAASHNNPPAHTHNWAALTAEAADEVNQTFGRRLMSLPGTWIGQLSTEAPAAPRRPWSEWHYWWQAHYLDALIDTAYLSLAQGDRITAHAELRRGRALLFGIMIRNFGLFPNYFYDDMAWLALAAGRLNGLSIRLEARPSWLARHAVRTLTRHLHGAHDEVLGGGIYWSRKRDFKNTPANGPAALVFARSGAKETAAAVADWLRLELFDPEIGLYLDGIHPSATGRDVEGTIYTYNQGPILAALLELGRPQDLDHAAALIAAISERLSTPGQGLRLEPGGDGSLFTGILCRYLALAARDPRLSALSRDTASNLVRDTAAQLAHEHPTQLSAAVQRWTVFAAAASL